LNQVRHQIKDGALPIPVKMVSLPIKMAVLPVKRTEFPVKMRALLLLINMEVFPLKMTT
jgi:hypothetical protein